MNASRRHFEMLLDNQPVVEILRLMCWNEHVSFDTKHQSRNAYFGNPLNWFMMDHVIKRLKRHRNTLRISLASQSFGKQDVRPIPHTNLSSHSLFPHCL